MANLYLDRRKDKRYFNQMHKKVGYGKFCIDCRGHPSVVTRVDRFDGCDCQSILDGSNWSCSYTSCSPTPIIKEQAYSIKEPVTWDENLEPIIP